MVSFANCSAIDAGCGGTVSGTILPQIISGNPQAILAHAAQVMQRATKLVGLLQDLERSQRQLREAWPRGSASDAAQQKLGNSFRNFGQTIQAIFSGVRELEAAAAKLQITQQGYNSVVSAMNPTVASLLSNPWTAAAGKALAATTAGSLSGFMKAMAGVFNAIGAGNIGNIVNSLATIVGEIEKLFSKDGGSGGGAGGGAGGGGQFTTQPYPNPGATPVQQPGGIPQVASPAGQAAAGYPNGYPGAGGGYPGAGGGYPGAGGGYPGAGGGYPGMPGGYYPPALNPNNGWVAVDPSAGGTVPGSYPPANTLPAPAPVDTTPPSDGGGGGGGGDSAGGDDDVTITASKGDLTVTVEVPIDTGRDFELDVSAESGGQSITSHIDVDADGSVSVK